MRALKICSLPCQLSRIRMTAHRQGFVACMCAAAPAATTDGVSIATAETRTKSCRSIAARRTCLQLLLACAACLPLTHCNARTAHNDGAIWEPAFDDALPVSTYKVVKRLKHDSAAFTQGLAFDGDSLLVEGTGLYGKSQLRRVKFDDTREVVQSTSLGSKYFGEGITICDDLIVQLTWKERVAFVYDRATFAKKGSFKYPYEGWGVAGHKKGGLVTTDGTNILRFWERVPSVPLEDEKKKKKDNKEGCTDVGCGWWKEVSETQLKMPDGRVVSKVLWRQEGGEIVQMPVRLNELENVGSEVWANMWPTETIARIDAESGVLKGWIDMRGLKNDVQIVARKQGRQIDVLNGIAFRAASASAPQALVVTGKWWPEAFLVDIVASPLQAAKVKEDEARCAWKSFPTGASGRAELVVAPPDPAAMRDFQEIDFL